MVEDSLNPGRAGEREEMIKLIFIHTMVSSMLTHRPISEAEPFLHASKFALQSQKPCISNSKYLFG